MVVVNVYCNRSPLLCIVPIQTKHIPFTLKHTISIYGNTVSPLPVCCTGTQLIQRESHTSMHNKGQTRQGLHIEASQTLMHSLGWAVTLGLQIWEGTHTHRHMCQTLTMPHSTHVLKCQACVQGEVVSCTDVVLFLLNWSICYHCTIRIQGMTVCKNCHHTLTCSWMAGMDMDMERMPGCLLAVCTRQSDALLQVPPATRNALANLYCYLYH